MGETFVVVGGDAAGMSAASKAKRDDPELDVIVYEQGEWVSYAACGMPYYVKGTVDDLEDLVAVTPQEFVEERDIDLRTHHEVVELRLDQKEVVVESDEGQHRQDYDHLLIGTGARAMRPPFDGMDFEGVFTLRSMDQADDIEEYVTATQPDSAAIVGGGYVGVEMAEALEARDVSVSMFEMLPHVLQPFGETAARVVEDHLEAEGVDLHLETAVEGFDGAESVERVAYEGGSEPADLVIVGVGVEPNVELAAEAGVELGETGAIETDEYGRTSEPNVYAAGDCAEATNAVTGEPDHVPLALTANRAGRAIGQTIAGSPTEVGEIAGTAIVKAFDLGVARTGIVEEEQAREAGFDPVSATIEAPTRPHYYPGAESLTITLQADAETGRVLGASMVGRDGVKRIDTVVTAVQAGLTVSELESLDLAYAPPFSPVWDPVLTAAKVLRGNLPNE